MKYMILIHSSPASRQIWEGFTDAQRAAGYGVYAALHEDLVASGELIVSEALTDPSLARRVPTQDGRSMTADGPFAEAKEHLAGFFLVESESFERALAIAARIPEASGGLVEVRPVLSLEGQEI